MKKGFTLAEVLITLGIIGVVAALAAPALNNSAQKAKVGPALSKFISTLENAHQHITADNEADSLTAVTNGDVDTYLTELSKYVKGVKDTKKIDSFTPKPSNYDGLSKADGSLLNGDMDSTSKIYKFADGSAMVLKHYNRDSSHSAGSYLGNVASLWFDINGFENKPNRAGKDEFRFYIDDSGAVYPDGGNIKKNIYEQAGINLSGNLWNESNGTCDETAVKRGGVYCGASVVDNGFKVIYKY